MPLGCFCLLQMLDCNYGTKRWIKKIAVNSNSNYDVVIINYYVMIILIIPRIPSILLFTLRVTYSEASVIY